VGAKSMFYRCKLTKKDLLYCIREVLKVSAVDIVCLNNIIVERTLITNHYFDCAIDCLLLLQRVLDIYSMNIR